MGVGVNWFRVLGMWAVMLGLGGVWGFGEGCRYLWSAITVMMFFVGTPIHEFLGTCRA